MKLTKNNYYSTKANKEYLSVSQYKDFIGTIGRTGCEFKALEKLNGNYTQEMTKELLMGSYVDAAWEGTLDEFKEKYPEIFSVKTGELKTDYQKAQEAFERTKQDELFSLYMSGQKQKIMTAELFGVDWKIRMDSYHPKKCIVDLKYIKDIHERFWVKDLGYFVNFIEYWGYDLQGAIYQKVVEANTGFKLPFYIAAVDKKSTPEIELIQVPQIFLDNALLGIEGNIKRITQLKNGEVEPVKCRKCDLCIFTKVLTTPISMTSLIEI